MASASSDAKATVADVAERIESLHLDDGGSHSSKNLSDHTNESLVATWNHASLSAILEIVKNVVAQLRIPTEGEPLTRATSCFERVGQITNLVSDLTEAAERLVIESLFTIGEPKDVRIKILFEHFDEEIRKIIRRSLGNSNKDAAGLELWKFGEACYWESTKPDGLLYLDDCHFQVEAEKWIEFWVYVLSNCPGGPTMFCPQQSRWTNAIDFQVEVVPRYLFRVYDRESSGRSNRDVVASSLSMGQTPGRNKTALLSLDKEVAAARLYGHLDKSCFYEAYLDDLMSWSSSLLFVIQYAIWRCYQMGLSPADVFFCAVDTRKFPPGQFARDRSLIEPCVDWSCKDKMHNFFRFRLQNSEYYNGEYLSQGILNHRDRATTFSLRDMIDAGLYQLYPEFDDVNGRTRWPKTVLHLRQIWSCEQRTTMTEIERAKNLAIRCLRSFEPTDMIVLLLTFKNRELRLAVDEEGLDPTQPIEVIRFASIIRAMSPHHRVDFHNPGDGGVEVFKV